MRLISLLRICLIISFLAIVQTIGHAAHIVGGELTYRCLGNNMYEFTLLVYRDCQSTGAQFDSAPGGLLGTVSIYDGNRIPEDLIENVILDPPIIENIPPNISNPCLTIPDDVCVESGRYTFVRELPLSTTDSYTITYQRCCRNGTINNVFNPGSTGSTYTIELTRFAQETCNSSPVFNDFPEIIICSNEELIFDHSATDLDGDQLEYSFCSPYTGGGLNGSNGMGDGADLNGVAPNPDAPSPYMNVSFVAPNFTAQFPLGGEPRVSIDANTGLITGTPVINGQFVVGVCVREFRNGVLLSTVRRDFQFNVESCQAAVRADIVEDVLLGDQSFLINVCGQEDFLFQNESVERDNISEFFWEFNTGPNGEVERYEEFEPLVSFPDTGLFMGVLVLNPGQICGDTAEIFVNVFPETTADFDLDFDTCIVGPVVFSDSSFTDAEQITDWDWDLDDGEFSLEQNPVVLYEIPGLKDVTLIVTDNNNCESRLDTQFNWSPIPSEVLVQPTSFIGCAPGGFVTFNNLTTPIDSTYDILWNFGDGSTSTEISPTHEFTDIGTFTVSVDIISPFDCEISETFNNFITIMQGPTADFTFSPDLITNLNPQVFFTDQSSSDVANWQWDFAGQGASQEQNPSFIFRDTGLQEIVLLTTAENGCTDTAFAVVDVVPFDSYFLPNAFTPNNDDRNDTYLGVGSLENISDFNMKIWDRWGELIFETENQFEGWNGQKNNSGPDLPNGVYVVLVTFESPREGQRQLQAYATLIR